MFLTGVSALHEYGRSWFSYSGEYTLISSYLNGENVVAALDFLILTFNY